jgi:hypothetical protein
VTDQVPVRPREIGDLCFGFLDAVLGKVGQAQVVGSPNLLDGD